MRVIGVGALLLVAGCQQDVGFRDLVPIVSVYPDQLDFGQVGPPLDETQDLLVDNVGHATLTLAGDIEGGAGGYTLVDGPVDLRLTPGEEVPVTVRFAPPTYRQYGGRLVLSTNDETHPLVTVPLLGQGVDLPFPDLRVDPGRTVSIDGVPIGGSDLLVFDIVNQGDAELDLDQVTLEGPPVFQVRIDPSGIRVAPGERTTMIVEYDPTDADGDAATVHLASNDPDEPNVDVLLLGNGGGTEVDRPIADISPCPSTVDLTGPETVHFSGAGSSDPDGLVPLTYQWIVSRRPDGSDADIPLDPSTTRDVDLRVDVAGTWELDLQVQNTVETPSVPAACVFEAIPEDDVHVELSWDTPAADVDLHLVQGGAALFDVPEDCDFCNKNPEWGVNGPDDDPRLDIDDRGGFGPENINILHPADGTYDVKVHYFAHNGDGPVQATVKVWLKGADVWEGTRVITASDVWSVGSIAWPAATFTADGSPNQAPARVGCR